MTSQPKKKDFFNGGKGIDLSEFESDIEVTITPPTSPSPQSPVPISFGTLSNRPLEFPQPLSASNSPPPVYPLPPHYGLYSPPYAAHATYLSHPMCPTSVAGGYPIPGMPYGALDFTAATHGSPNFSSNAFTEAHLARNFGHHPTYTSDSWITSSVDKEIRARDPEGENNQRHETSSSSSTPTRQQKCSLCFNHGITKEKKGHKWQCTFKNCECSRCIITKGRQKTMRDQQKLTRHLQKMQL